MSASEPIAFLNDAWLPASQMSVPIHDAGFVMGATVTDLCRTFRHRLYRWSDHLARFRSSCLGTGLVARPDDEITAIAEKLVAHNAGLLSANDDLALVVFATPGPIGYYAGQGGGAGEGPPTFGMHTFPLPFARYRRLFTHGAHLVTPQTMHAPKECVPPQIKQRSRMHWWLAEREVRRIEPGASALLLDADGNVTETAAANFLIAEDGVVLSPPRAEILEGVSRHVVRELCAELDIQFFEVPLNVEDCLTAHEAMLTSTPYCIAGVSSLNGKSIPWPGPILTKLQAAWSAKVGVDIVAQILAANSV
jgi:branched-chain amino acid aminotransferase